MKASGAGAVQRPGGAADTGGTAPAGVVAAAWKALAGVYDPELGLDLVSLGLVYGVRWAEGVLAVEMTLTTPGCPVSGSLPEMAKAAVAEAIGCSAVAVRVTWDPPWSPAMMNPAAAAALGVRNGS